jgi:hypothetical protein
MFCAYSDVSNKTAGDSDVPPFSSDTTRLSPRVYSDVVTLFSELNTAL